VDHIQYDFDTRDSILEHLKFLLQSKYDDWNIQFKEHKDHNLDGHAENGLNGQKDKLVEQEHPIFHDVAGSEMVAPIYASSQENANLHPLVKKVIHDLQLDQMVSKSKQFLSIFCQANEVKRQRMNLEEQIAMDLCTDVLEAFLKANQKLRTGLCKS
jgi:hypothetical protein